MGDAGPVGVVFSAHKGALAVGQAHIDLCTGDSPMIQPRVTTNCAAGVLLCWCLLAALAAPPGAVAWHVEAAQKEAALSGAALPRNVIVVDWDGTGDYVTIQEALDASTNGDTIIVAPSGPSPAGAYVENTVFPAKAITLRSVDPDDPASKHKHALLNDKRFRQALSLAINREQIIKAEYNGQAEPAQCAPGPASFFYEPALYKSHVEYDPARANELLDDIGLTKRDPEGCRTLPDGSRMTFYMNFSFTGLGPGQFIVDDWAAVGIRLVIRERSRGLFMAELFARKADFYVWIGSGESPPLLDPRTIVPTSGGAHFASGFARWYQRGGLHGLVAPGRKAGVEPPPHHPLRRAMEVYDAARAYADVEKQREAFREALLIAADNLWTINISTPPPVLMVVKDGFRNVPKMSVYSWNFLSPGNAIQQNWIACRICSST